MIHAFAADRSDQSFGKAILPRRGRRYRLIPDAHGANSAQGDFAINAISIPDEGAWCFIPRECLSQLTRNPFCRWILRNVDPDQLSPIQPDDDEGIEQVEANGWDNKQVHGRDVRRVVTQKRTPSLTWR